MYLAAPRVKKNSITADRIPMNQFRAFRITVGRSFTAGGFGITVVSAGVDFRERRCSLGSADAGPASSRIATRLTMAMRGAQAETRRRAQRARRRCLGWRRRSSRWRGVRERMGMGFMAGHLRPHRTDPATVGHHGPTHGADERVNRAMPPARIM